MKQIGHFLSKKNEKIGQKIGQKTMDPGPIQTFLFSNLPSTPVFAYL
jgi:hypothetical protein